MSSLTSWKNEIEQWFPGLEHDTEDYDDPVLPSTLDMTPNVRRSNSAFFLGMMFEQSGRC